MKDPNSRTPSIIGIGEALYDVYPAAPGDPRPRESLGGAPLNFSVHANRLARLIGKTAAPASRIGGDERGARLLAELESAGVSTALMQRDAQHATGIVTVSDHQSGEAQYEIEPQVAWDFLELTPEWQAAAANCEAVSYGTLAQRHQPARETIEDFLIRASHAIKIFDINLRQDFYDYSALRRGCALATVLKLNRAELDVLADMLSIRGNGADARIRVLFDRFPLEFVLLTQGSDGTLIHTPDGAFAGPKVRYDPVPGADSVGAGDAAAAAAVVAILAGLPPERIAEAANHAGAFVASRPGATPELPDEITTKLERRSAPDRRAIQHSPLH